MARSVLSHPEDVLVLFRTDLSSRLLLSSSEDLFLEHFKDKFGTNVLQVFQNSSIKKNVFKNVHA